MKLASIVPMTDVQRTFDGDYAMLLSHLSDYYVPAAFDNANCYKIMDNSLIELGGAVDMNMLVHAAMKCGANEIILPDVFCDRKGTIDSVDSSLVWLHKRNMLSRFRLMVVCQGNNPSEFEECFRHLSQYPEIHCIGIPKVAETLLPEGRPGFEYLWQGSSKVIHLLGCWTSLSEFLKYKHPENIRSADTCIPALNSIYCKEAWDARTQERTIDLIKDKLREPDYTRITEELRRFRLL